MRKMYIIRDSETGDIVECKEGALSFARKRNAEVALASSVAWDIHCQMEFLKSSGYGDLVKNYKDLMILRDDQVSKHGSVSFDVDNDCKEILSQIQDTLYTEGFYTVYEEVLQNTPNKRFFIEQVSSFKINEKG